MSSIVDPILRVLAKPENLPLACEIYNEVGDEGPGTKSAKDPVVEFLQKSENARLVRDIRQGFPNVVKGLAKTVFDAVYKQCQLYLEKAPKWTISFDPDYPREQWPALDIHPIEGPTECWSFYLSMNAKDFPITFEHGVIYSQNGGRPKSMSEALESAVLEVEAGFGRGGFIVKPLAGKTWFAHTSNPYKPYSLGNDPTVLVEIFDGTLATQITEEFCQHFSRWSENIEHLNSLL